MKIIITLIISLPSFAIACPFCDAGANDAAAFILTIFGLLTLAGIFCFLVFLKRCGLKSKDSSVEMSVLKAEGIVNERK